MSSNLAPVNTASQSPSGSGAYYDKKFDCEGFRIVPGDYHVTRDRGSMLVTILGSCVAACIRDPLLGIGGMNHFLLPENSGSTIPGIADEGTRYGNHAMELLINDLLKMGGKKERFEVKVFGGAHVGNMNVSIGSDNANFILEYLKQESLNLVSHDLGGNRARKIHFFPDSGRVARFMFQTASDSAVSREEMEFRKKIKTPAPSTDIELFD